MKILITGANGQLGQDIAKILSTKGIDFIAAYHTGGNINLDVRNINDIKNIVNEYDINTIINCGAYNDVDKAESDSYNAFLVNGIGCRNLAIVSEEKNLVLMHFSTDFIFDGQKGALYNISDAPRPISKYGESKLLGEHFIQQIMRKYFIIRTSCVFGKGNMNFPKKVLNWSEGNTVINVVDDVIDSRSNTVDLAQASFDLLNTKIYGIYHITNQGYCSRYEWAKFILEQIKWNGELKPVKSSFFNLPASRPPFTALDNFGTKETIGYELPHWKDAISRFLKEIERL